MMAGGVNCGCLGCCTLNNKSEQKKDLAFDGLRESKASKADSLLKGFLDFKILLSFLFSKRHRELRAFKSSTHGCREKSRNKNEVGRPHSASAGKGVTMKRLLVLLVVVFAASFSAWAINVRAQDQAQSLAEAAPLHFMCMVVGCDENGTPVEFRGTGSLILNDSSVAGALVAGHSLRDPGATEDRCPKWKLYFEPPILEGAKYNVMEVTDVFHYARQDITLLKLNGPVKEIDGSLTKPIEMYHGPLDVNTPLKIGGYGVSIDPSWSDLNLTTPLDYKRRVAWEWLFSFGLPVTGLDPTFGYMSYNTSLAIPGIAAYCDSGGFVAIEDSNGLSMVGLIKGGRHSGVDTWTAFEYFQYDDGQGQLFFKWLEETIASITGTITGSIVIDDGAQYATNPVVTLSLSASLAKATNTVTEMSFSEDGATWSEWEPFAESTLWTLSDGDGVKTVNVRFKDSAGNVSTTFSDSIILDTTAPLTESQVVSTHANAAVGITLVGSDATSAPVTISVISGPNHGTYSEAVYQPSPNFVGTDSITYEVTDKAGNISSATVTVTVINGVPVANAGRNQQKLVGQTVYLDGSASIDADGDALSFAWSIVSKPSGSQAALSDASTEKPTFAADASGTYMVQLVVSDGVTNSTPSEVVVAVTAGTVVVNSGAVYSNSQVVTLCITASNGTGEDAITEMRLSADGSTWDEWEPFATPITWELPNGDGLKPVFVQVRDAAQNASAVFSGSIVLDMTPPTAQPQSVSLHMNGSVGITLTGSDLTSAPVSIAIVTDPAHGTFAAGRYTPDTNYVGDDALTYSVTDAAGNSSTAFVSITVMDQAPVVSNQAVTTNQGQAVAVVLSASDPDGDAVTVGVVLGPAHGTLTGTGANLSYTPQAGYTGSDSFTYQATDGALTSNVGIVSITVNSVVNTGSLTVTLQPSSAVSAGAWAVDGGTWRTSGETVTGLTTGVHVITFKPIAASGRTTWTTPQSQTVTVFAGKTVQISGTYTATTPPLSFWGQFIQWLLSLFGLKF